MAGCANSPPTSPGEPRKDADLRGFFYARFRLGWPSSNMCPTWERTVALQPIEMEYFIRESVGLMEKLPDVMLEINARRYSAERAYIARKQTQLAHYGRNNVPATFARAMADTNAEYHYAEGTERALRTKVKSMLNINRAIAAQFGATR